MLSHCSQALSPPSLYLYFHLSFHPSRLVSRIQPKTETSFSACCVLACYTNTNVSTPPINCFRSLYFDFQPQPSPIPTAERKMNQKLVVVHSSSIVVVVVVVVSTYVVASKISSQCNAMDRSHAVMEEATLNEEGAISPRQGTDINSC